MADNLFDCIFRENRGVSWCAGECVDLVGVIIRMRNMVETCMFYSAKVN